jgi:UDP-galactopyranose mutase
VYTHGALIPYPFQRSFEQIPDPEVVEQCRRGLELASGVDAADNFEDYLVGRFGEGIAEHFMLPYNRKLWARDIKKISCEWTAERVAAPKGASEAFQTTGGKRKPLQSNTMVGYPAQGGFQEIFNAFVPHVGTVRTGTELVRIDPESRTAYAANGETVRWDRLVSTLPVHRLLELTDGVPDPLIADVATLEAMSLHLLLLLVGRPIPDAPHRIYVADPAVPPHKIAFNHTSSSSLRARPVHAIMAEISYSDNKPLGDPADVRDRTISFLVEAGIIAETSDVVDSRVIDVPLAYPVYTHDRPATMAAARDWLGSLGIETLGRFGEWEYVNSDKCVRMGMDMATKLNNGLDARA